MIVAQLIVYTIFSSLFSRALLLNIPGMFIMITLSCLAGLVMYAYYADCDPLTIGIIDEPNQV